MEAKPRDLLDVFGQTLMTEGRDRAIRATDQILDGKSKAPVDKQLHARIVEACSDEQLELIRDLVPLLIDTALHYTLWMFETDERFDISVRTDGGSLPSIRTASDGLTGDLYRWIPEFSQER